MENVLTDKSSRPAGWFQNSNLAQAWLVLVLALIFGAVLAAIQVRLSPLIAANKMNETLEKIPELVWGSDGARQAADADIIPGSVEIKKNGAATFYSVFRVARQGKLAGWVVRTGGQGYADRIELLIGLAPDAASITGLFILEQKETPGLGANIVLPGWRRQFIGKKTGQPLVVVKGGVRTPHDIDAITGATISSRSVVRLVNRSMHDMAAKLASGEAHFSNR